jgi:CRISPR-associated protein Cas2
MIILVTYDIQTLDLEGRRRLRKVAKACLNYGQRVQFSVFECRVPPALWVALRSKLLGIINPEEDSLRFYFLGEDDLNRAEHHGTKATIDFEGSLVV